jgi:hypothetical protein
MERGHDLPYRCPESARPDGFDSAVAATSHSYINGSLPPLMLQDFVYRCSRGRIQICHSRYHALGSGTEVGATSSPHCSNLTPGSSSIVTSAISDNFFRASHHDSSLKRRWRYKISLFQHYYALEQGPAQRRQLNLSAYRLLSSVVDSNIF